MLSTEGVSAKAARRADDGAAMSNRCGVAPSGVGVCRPNETGVLLLVGGVSETSSKRGRYFFLPPPDASSTSGRSAAEPTEN